ncbi:MAG: hypothetical protein M1343_09340 [Chloroflexi bacterium]|nr:hypothetical protein [Chloroflexota bacterium]MDA8187300.1 hypothetical protein [Dehalococcoidales bacterium]
MIWLKACPRCGGDLFEERDWYTRNIKCFQCGRTLTEAQARQLRMKTAIHPAHEEAAPEKQIQRGTKRRKAA